MDFKWKIELPEPSQDDPEQSFREVVGGAAAGVLLDLVSDAQAGTPYSYADGWDLEEDESSGTVSWGIANDWRFWWVREYDMPPHLITAAAAPFLVFEYNGHLVQVPSVNHPGSKGNHLIEQLWKSYQPQLAEVTQQATYAWLLDMLGSR